LANGMHAPRHPVVCRGAVPSCGQYFRRWCVDQVVECGVAVMPDGVSLSEQDDDVEHCQIRDRCGNGHSSAGRSREDHRRSHLQDLCAENVFEGDAGARFVRAPFFPSFNKAYPAYETTLSPKSACPTGSRPAQLFITMVDGGWRYLPHVRMGPRDGKTWLKSWIQGGKEVRRVSDGVDVVKDDFAYMTRSREGFRSGSQAHRSDQHHHAERRSRRARARVVLKNSGKTRR